MCLLLPMLEKRDKARLERERRARRTAEAAAISISRIKSPTSPAETTKPEESVRVVTEAPVTQKQTESTQTAQTPPESPNTSSSPRARVPKHVVKGPASSRRKKSTPPQDLRLQSTSESGPAPAAERKATSAPKSSNTTKSTKPPYGNPSPMTGPTPKTATSHLSSVTDHDMLTGTDTMSDNGSGMDDAVNIAHRTPPHHQMLMERLPLPSPPRPTVKSKAPPPPPIATSNYKPPSVADVPEQPTQRDAQHQDHHHHQHTQHHQPATAASRHVHWAPSPASQSPTPPTTKHRSSSLPTTPNKPSTPPRRSSITPTTPILKPRRRVRWEVESQSDVGVDAGPSATDNLRLPSLRVKLDVVIDTDSSLDGSAIDDHVDLARRMPGFDISGRPRARSEDADGDGVGERVPRSVESLVGRERRAWSGERD